MNYYVVQGKFGNEPRVVRQANLEDGDVLLLSEPTTKAKAEAWMNSHDNDGKPLPKDKPAEE